MMKLIVEEFFPEKTVLVELTKVEVENVMVDVIRVKGAKKVKKLFNRSLDKKEISSKIIKKLELKDGINEIKVKKIIKYIEKANAKSDTKSA